MFTFFNKAVAENSGVAYDYEFNGIDGDQIKLSDYKDKVIVVVNVASRCGYTPQYEDLQTLYNKYKNKNLIVIGVPTNNFKQEPGTNDQIKDFCETNFSIDFPMTEKVVVKGKEAHPLYKWLASKDGANISPKWNFHKYLINTDGTVANWFMSTTGPQSKKVITAIEDILPR